MCSFLKWSLHVAGLRSENVQQLKDILNVMYPPATIPPDVPGSAHPAIPAAPAVHPTPPADPTPPEVPAEAPAESSTPADTTMPDPEAPADPTLPEIPEATMPEEVHVESPPTSGIESAEAVADGLLSQPPPEPSSGHPDHMQTLQMEIVEEWPPQPQHPKTSLLRWKKPYTTKSYDQYGNQVGEQESSIQSK